MNEAEQRARKEAEEERQQRILAMTHVERHKLHRKETMKATDYLSLVDQDFRGENLVAASWMKANARRCLLEWN